MDAQILALAKKQAEMCKIFSSTTRVLILWTLDEQEMTVSDVATAIEASLQNTSQHLRLMKDRGVLSSRREGQAVYYRLNENERNKKSCLTLCQALQDSLNIDCLTEKSSEQNTQEGY